MAIQGATHQLPTLIGSALADIAMGRTDTDPLDRILAHGADARRKPGFLPVVGPITA